MDFPGGPMVKTLYSGHRFNGQEIFQMLCGTAKKKKKNLATKMSFSTWMDK